MKRLLLLILLLPLNSFANVITYCPEKIICPNGVKSCIVQGQDIDLWDRPSSLWPVSGTYQFVAAYINFHAGQAVSDVCYYNFVNSHQNSVAIRNLKGQVHELAGFPVKSKWKSAPHQQPYYECLSDNPYDCAFKISSVRG